MSSSYSLSRYFLSQRSYPSLIQTATLLPRCLTIPNKVEHISSDCYLCTSNTTAKLIYIWDEDTSKKDSALGDSCLLPKPRSSCFPLAFLFLVGVHCPHRAPSGWSSTPSPCWATPTSAALCRWPIVVLVRISRMPKSCLAESFPCWLIVCVRCVRKVPSSSWPASPTSSPMRPPLTPLRHPLPWGLRPISLLLRKLSSRLALIDLTALSWSVPRCTGPFLSGIVMVYRRF